MGARQAPAAVASELAAANVLLDYPDRRSIFFDSRPGSKATRTMNAAFETRNVKRWTQASPVDREGVHTNISQP
jgi:hypothetical protein